jgi:hypothetical protein
MSQVWTRRAAGGEQMILLAMADHANDEGGDCYPSVGRIAWKTGYSIRQVQNIMAKLRARGALVIVRPGGGRGRATEYRIVLEALPEKDPFVPPERVQSFQGFSAERVQSDAETLQSDAERVQSDAGNPATAIAPQPSEKHQEEEPSYEPSSEEEYEPVVGEVVPDARVDQTSIFPETRPVGLHEVREKLHEVAKLHGTTRPTDDAIQATMDAYPDKDAVAVADDLLFWAKHGNGSRRKIKSVASTYRNFLRKADISEREGEGKMEQEAKMRSFLDSMKGEESWDEWRSKVGGARDAE